MAGDPTVDRKRPEWSDLSDFLGAYLHQDFDAEYTEPWDAVVDFGAGASGSRRAAVTDQLRHLLALSNDERVIEEAVDGLGMAYYPLGDGYSSYRYWLTAVADFLEDPEAHPGPPERDAPVPREEGAGGRVSTFTDEATAERAVAENLEGNRAAIEAWRRAAGPNQAFEWQHAAVVGRLAPPEATLETIHDVNRSRAILRRTAQAAEGWFVMVAYPIAAPDPAVASRIDRGAPEWEALWALLGGYLHQDVDIHGGVEGAVTAFETDASSEQVAVAAVGLRRLLDDVADDDLAAATEWLGMDYHPPGDGRTHREWLTTLAERLER